jgi:hypothetical protein
MLHAAKKDRWFPADPFLGLGIGPVGPRSYPPGSRFDGPADMCSAGLFGRLRGGNYSDRRAASFNAEGYAAGG